MVELKRQLKEDKAIRSAARSILGAQVEQVRLGLSGQRVGEKLADKVGDPVLEKLGNTGLPTKVIAAAAAGAASVVAVALAWKPILGLLDVESNNGDAETDDDA